MLADELVAMVQIAVYSISQNYFKEPEWKEERKKDSKKNIKEGYREKRFSITANSIKFYLFPNKGFSLLLNWVLFSFYTNLEFLFFICVFLNFSR